MSFCSFVPQKLEVKHRPELSVFPLNVLFVSFTSKNGLRIMGSATYEPDLASFKKEGGKSTMEYHNIYGGDNRILLIHNGEQWSYSGEKFVKGKLVGTAYGAEWDMFFVHLTMMGLSAGERCMFEEMV
ncbi:hypothetical protein A2108_01275 [Candidatus Wolfebacteria bacterium GWA1_42_9]|uniref:Uncharacterized protein n=2 Tax=Candidatus Wolfeibacteriota TaxID=1752735 RepID=A0A1F8DP28_9BACT|nr:MAG: hypothetical protein A2108_01275 [Candidatus Wolfebacteria bacterium GWA1_42_9]